MSLRAVFDAAGAPARLDDMSPASRTLALLLEHAAARRAAGLSVPCPCADCTRRGACFRGEPTETGELLLIYTPPVMP